MNYVDGFLVAVPNEKKEEYLDFAKVAAKIFKDHGALQYVECWGNDVPEGKVTSFPMAVKCEENETVVFSWVSWASKAARDAGMKQAMEDPRFDFKDNPMPFDGSRLIFGGFEVILNE